MWYECKSKCTDFNIYKSAGGIWWMSCYPWYGEATHKPCRTEKEARTKMIDFCDGAEITEM